MQSKYAWGMACAGLLALGATAQAAGTRSDAVYYSLLGWGDTFTVQDITTSGGDTEIFGNMGIAEDVDNVNLTDLSLKEVGFPNDADYPTHHGDFVIWQSVASFNGGDLHNTNMENFAAVDSAVNAAAANARSISAFWAAQSGTVLNSGNFIDGSITINNGGGSNVYQISDGLHLGSNEDLIIRGGANDFVVINVLGSSTSQQFKLDGGGMTLQNANGTSTLGDAGYDGITADHIIWNFLSNGTDANDPDGVAEFTGQNSIYGTLIGDDWDFKINGNSHLYGAAWFGQDITIVSNADIHYVPPTTSVPLPGAVWMGLSLLGMAGAFATVRRRRALDLA
jgi:hypothetical protein